MTRKLRAPEWLLAVGVIVLFAATFKDWFTLHSTDSLDLVAPDAQSYGDTVLSALNVWDLSVARWFVYMALISGALLIVAAMFGETVHYAIVMATPTVIFGFGCAVSLVVRLIWPPQGTQIEPAFYVAVAGSLVLFIAACWSMRSEFVPDGFKTSPEPERVHLDSAP